MSSKQGRGAEPYDAREIEDRRSDPHALNMDKRWLATLDAANAERDEAQEAIATAPPWFKYKSQDWREALNSIDAKLRENSALIVDLGHARSKAEQERDEARRAVDAWQQTNHDTGVKANEFAERAEQAERQLGEAVAILDNMQRLVRSAATNGYDCPLSRGDGKETLADRLYKRAMEANHFLSTQDAAKCGTCGGSGWEYEGPCRECAIEKGGPNAD